MVRRIRRRFRRKKKGGFFRTAGRVVGVAGKALATAMAVKRLLNVEYKVKDTAGNFQAGAAGTGTVVYLSDIDQGDGYDARDGLSVKATKLTFKCRAMSASTNAGFLRVCIVKDKENRGANPTYGDIFSTGGSSYASAMRNLNNVERFVILMDKVIRLGTTSSVDATNQKWINKTFRLNDKIKYTGTGSGVSDANTNALFLVVSPDTLVTNTPNINYFARLRYLDN